MKRCPITYELINDNEDYSQKGLKQLSPKLQNLNPLNLSADEQRREAIARVGKMSIQGVQVKLSAQLKIKGQRFEIVDQQGHYILKPPSEYYPELPENEAITMTMAAVIGLAVPVHGLVYAKDGSFTYFIKRFDRAGHIRKIPVEDFAQLSGSDRNTKYESSMEKVTTIIKEFCSFPKIEMVKFFKLTLFNFLVGNEDMHLKNFSLITHGKITALSPSYDLLNTTIAQKNTKEELALPLNGKKNNLSAKDFFDYFAIERLSLNAAMIFDIKKQFQHAIPKWQVLIVNSFLSQTIRGKYLSLLEERIARLKLNAD